MKKQTFNPFEKLSGAELGAALAQMETALDMVARNEWSMGQIYGAHNKLFGLNESPAACGDCLTAKVKDLRQFKMDNKDAITGVVEAAAAESMAAQTPGELLVFEDDTTAMFDATGAAKDGSPTGTLTADVGKTLKAGTYTLKDKRVLTIAPGGKATLRPAEEDLL